MTFVPPKNPADCLAHCRDALTDLEYDLAVNLIHFLMMMTEHAATVAAIEESHRRAMAVIDRHANPMMARDRDEPGRDAVPR